MLSALYVGITIGMSMTEKQGGSDVRANTTMAVKASTGTTTYICTSIYIYYIHIYENNIHRHI